MGHPQRNARGLAAVLFLLAPGCDRTERAQPASPPAPLAPAPAAAPPLDRAALLEAVDAAASAAAAGASTPASSIAGREFRLALPFGCGSATGDPAGVALNAELDAPQGVLRLSARPEVWSSTPWVRQLFPAADIEALEGFWVSRPWLKREVCPAPGVALAAPPASETVGLVQAFTAETSRTLRRGDRPYQAVRRLAGDQTTSVAGYRLVLSGRVEDVERPIRCALVHPDRRPVCLVQVELQRVGLETPEGEAVAEWTS